MSNLIVYRTSPNAEHRAAAELRDAGIKARVPRDRNGKRNPFTKAKPAVVPGYVFATRPYRNAFAQHVKGALGEVPRAQLIRLYPRRDRGHAPPAAFKEGDAVLIKVGTFADVPATVTGYRTRTYFVEFTMAGKTHRQAIHEMHVKPG